MACPAVPCFSILSHKHKDFLEKNKVNVHKMCFEGQDCMVDGSEVPSETTAITPVPYMCCMVL